MPRRKLRTTFAVVAFCLLGTHSSALQQATDPTPNDPPSTADEAARLDGLCRLWTTVELQHPWLVTSDLDWDAPFLAAVEPVRAADDEAAYVAALATLLGALGDPATEILPPPSPDPTGPATETPDATEATPGDPAAAAAEPFALREDGIGVLRMTVLEDLYVGSWFALAGSIKPATGIILDLRRPGRSPDDDPGPEALGYLASVLSATPFEVPGERFRAHWGWAPERGATSGGYHAALVTDLSQRIEPAPGTAAKRLVALLDAGSAMPPVLVGLVAAGSARIVREVAAPTAAIPVARESIALPWQREAVVRSSEIALPDLPADRDELVPPVDGRDAAMERAVALLAGDWSARNAAGGLAAAAPLPRQRPARAYRDAALPDAPLRLLAGCRLWGVIEHLYPYRDLIPDWSGAFRTAAPALLAADTEAAYGRALLELADGIADGHTALFGGATEHWRGAATVELDLLELDGEMTVVALSPAAAEAGVAIGDAIRSVDGRPLAAAIEAQLPIVAASTPVTERRRAALAALRGPKGTPARLELVAADGRSRTVELPREAVYWSPKAGGPSWRRLATEGHPELGYVDLTRLETTEVDAMLADLADTTALVFDLRGYPRGTAWPLAARLNTRGASIGARFRRPHLLPWASHDADVTHGFAQRLPDPEPPFYPGRTVMLIDERAISQSEHTGLFLEQAAGTVFIGSPTAGANGDVTNVLLPGGIQLSFTGHDVRHADGRQLQRVGLQPTVAVRPTRAGLAAGRDEVLEAAIGYLTAATTADGR